jgi:hypothetical protein
MDPHSSCDVYYFTECSEDLDRVKVSLVALQADESGAETDKYGF